MVVNVFAEGGILGGNDDASTIANSEALREELNRFMQRALGRDDISIVVKKCASYKMAAKEFVKEENVDSYLYVDLDRLPELRAEWFESLRHDGIAISEERSDHVCFWIQEMESWFLKQPQAIEDWAADEGYQHKANKQEPISEHKSIKDKDIEHLKHKASEILKVILRQVLEPVDKAKVSATGKVRDIRYGKLRHAPGIIAHLNPEALKACDRELQAFCDKVNSRQMVN